MYHWCEIRGSLKSYPFLICHYEVIASFLESILIMILKFMGKCSHDPWIPNLTATTSTINFKLLGSFYIKLSSIEFKTRNIRMPELHSIACSNNRDYLPLSDLSCRRRCSDTRYLWTAKICHIPLPTQTHSYTIPSIPM